MKKVFIFFASSLFLICFNRISVRAQFTTDEAASHVLGATSFTSGGGKTQNTMGQIYALAIDKSGNLYVSDYSNSRVLIFKNAISKANGANADYVLGQPDFTTGTFPSVHTQKNFACQGISIDSSGNLYIADVSANRVLIFKNVESQVNAGTFTNDTTADYVLGQTDFTSSGNNTTQNGFRGPQQPSIDPSGNLYLSDHINNRVLIFKNIQGQVNAGTLTNGANADYVLGQPNFTTNTLTSITQRDFQPAGNVLDKSGNLYIVDYQNWRVMIFKNVVSQVNAGTLINDTTADFVLGVNNFTSFGGGTTQNSLHFPFGTTIDASGDLYVADQNNNRVMIFNNAASLVTNGTLTNGANADVVLGQSIFTTSNTGTTANSLNQPLNVSIDSSGNLYVADGNNARVLIFNGSVLPVSLISFTATMPDASDVSLKWSTTSEMNTDHFELMRSADGVNYSNIASVKAAGNSNTILDYSYVDNIFNLSFAGVIYYQLKEVDIDGKFQLSPIILVRPGKNSLGNKLWPNPFSDQMQLTINAEAPEAVKVSLISTDGKIVYRQQYSLAAGENQISILNLDNLPAGVYQLTGFNQKKILINQKVVKQ